MILLQSPIRGGTKGEDWQHLFYWYAGEIETNVKVNDNFDVSITIIPGISSLLIFRSAYGQKKCAVMPLANSGIPAKHGR